MSQIAVTAIPEPFLVSRLVATRGVIPDGTAIKRGLAIALWVKSGGWFEGDSTGLLVVLGDGTFAHWNIDSCTRVKDPDLINSYGEPVANHLRISFPFEKPSPSQEAHR